jgi:hypothetical protein
MFDSCSLEFRISRVSSYLFKVYFNARRYVFSEDKIAPLHNLDHQGIRRPLMPCRKHVPTIMKFFSD